MRVIALTGNIAAGKSTVTAELRRLGAHVIEADAIVHELQRSGEPVYRAIVARFGTGAVDPGGELNRQALRAIMLREPRAKADLEAIVHPAVSERIVERIAQAEASGDALVVVDIPLLFEAADPLAYDGIILVNAPISQRRQRLIVERNVSPDEADQLIAAQLPAESKRTLATWIIDNDRDLESLIQQVRRLWPRLLP